jgi:hypothetical protein
LTLVKDLTNVDARQSSKVTIIIRPGDVPGFQTEVIVCGEGDNDTVLLYGFPRGVQIPTGTNPPVTITDPWSRGTYLIDGSCEVIARR